MMQKAYGTGRQDFVVVYVKDSCGSTGRSSMGQFFSQFLKREAVSGMIFDVDGTLLDSMPVWAHSGERYLATLGIHAPKTLGRILFSMTMQEGAQYIKKTYGLSQTAEEIQAGIIHTVEEAYDKEMGCKRAADAFLKELQAAGIPMTVVTSGDRRLVLAAFERLGIAPYFKEILTCTEFGSGKDDPAIFHAAAKRMGSLTASTWVVEDALYAIRTAKEAGYRVIGIADASSREDGPQIFQLADYFIADYAVDLDKIPDCPDGHT